MFDIGPYYITTLVSLLGPVKRVAAMTKAAHKQRTIGSGPDAGQQVPVEVPTHVAGVMELGLPRRPSVIATMITSFDIQATRLRWIEIHGTEATLAVPDPNTFGGRVQLRRAGDREWTEVPVERPHARTEPRHRPRGHDVGDAHRTSAPRVRRARVALRRRDAGVHRLGAEGTAGEDQVEVRDVRRALPADLPEDVFDD